MAIRLGDVLMQQGVLSEAQRDEALAAQAKCGRPLGTLVEEMFGVSPRDVERAWATQYADITGHADLDSERVESGAIDLVDRRQAWQFQLLPLREEGGELLVATTEEALARAMRFAAWRIGRCCSFVVAEASELSRHLAAHYPLAGAELAWQTVRRPA